MKILLLGEYSGLYNNLRDGLIALGHDVTLASSGDAWKNFPSDIRFDMTKSATLNKVVKNLSPFFMLNKLSNFDVVQIINPMILNRAFGLNEIFIRHILKNNNKVFLSGAGDDSFYSKAVRDGKFRYAPLADYISIDLQGKSFPYDEAAVIEWNNELADRVDGIIPIAYEYAEAYRNHKKIKMTIPMPINVSKIKYVENRVNGKIIFFHGLNRPGFKGTRHVSKAFDEIRKTYERDAEFIIAGNMPYLNYQEMIKKTNVIVDQTSSYSCGMNALISMAMGKVVLGGNEPESTAELGQENSPAINILADSNSIRLAIQRLLDNKSSIMEIGWKSRLFIERNHDHINIAKRYLEVWGS